MSNNIYFSVVDSADCVYNPIIHNRSYKIGLYSMANYYTPYTTLNDILACIGHRNMLLVITVPLDSEIMRNGWIHTSKELVIHKMMPLWDMYTIQYLVALGIDIDRLLMCASKYGHLDIVQYLFLLGANINTQLNFAIRYASLNGHLDIVQYLVSVGADIHTCDDLAIQWASINGHLDVVKYLVSEGADISAINDLVLRVTTTNGHTNVVQYLVSIGHNI